MTSIAEIIRLVELGPAYDVCLEQGRREAFGCDGRAVFDTEGVGGKEVRYSLSAVWAERRPLLFGIGFNPSKARATSGDKTVDRVIAEAKPRYGGLFWVNLHAGMETDSGLFIEAGSTQGRYNDEQIRRVLSELHPGEAQRDVLLAWGNDGPPLLRWSRITPRDPRVRTMMFGTRTAKRRPRHPSRLRGGTELRPV